MRRVSRLATKPSTFYKGIRIKADIGLHEQIAEQLVPRLPPGSRILDYGCGEGALSARLADLGYEVLSVDLDLEGFRASTKFVCLDFNDQSAVRAFTTEHVGDFDAVIGVEVIEHVENPWQYIRDLRGLTRRGGLILITTPNVTSWYSRIAFLRTGRFHQFADSDRAYGHINPVAPDELRLIAEMSGLAVISIVPGGWLPRLWLTGGIRDLAWNIAGFLGSFFMSGLWDGWCVICLLQRSSEGGE